MNCRSGGIALAAALLAAGCETLDVPPPDPQVRQRTSGVAERAAGFYAGLATKTAPECGFAANEAAYADLRAEAAGLTTIADATPDDRVLRNQAAGLARTLEAAERSHRLASASTDDRHGVCLAPAAIRENAGAVARATASILLLQRRRGR